MIHTLLIPTPLRPYTGRRDTVDVEGGTVGEMLADLASKYDGVRAHLFGSDGRLRNFVNVYVNDEDIRFLQREATPVGAGDTVSIIPSVAGGAGAEAQVEALPGLSREEVFRYSRHLLIPEVGLEGQRKLKAARVLCIGAGGLGSPVAMYLAAAGVGTIGIVDFDTVDFSNLQRQILHSTADVGRPKLDSAKDTLAALNPGVTIVPHEVVLSSENALSILAPVRRRRGRDRQLPDPVPRQRRLRPARQAERVREHLPVRRTGVGLRRPGRTVLPLPVSRAAAARAGAELRRGRRAGRSARHHRHHPGDRGDQADRGSGEPLVGRLLHLRRAEDAIPRGAACAGIPRARSAAITRPSPR